MPDETEHDDTEHELKRLAMRLAEMLPANSKLRGRVMRDFVWSVRKFLDADLPSK